PRDQGGRGFQNIDLERAPHPLVSAVIETEKAPQTRPQHDRHGDEGLGAVFEEDAAVRAAYLAQCRLDHLALLAAAGPFVEAAAGVDQRYRLIPGVAAEQREPWLGPIIAAVLDQGLIGATVNLEQCDPAGGGGMPESFE